MASALVIGGTLVGIIGMVVASRHAESEDASKWIGSGLALLAVGTLLMRAS